jgi:hypothetical protein
VVSRRSHGKRRRGGPSAGRAARLEGREFYVAEVAESAFDEESPEDTFRWERPGVEFRRVDR